MSRSADSAALRLRAVILDFNGVLVDDEHVHFELFRDILAEEGVVLSERQYHERFLGYDDRGCFEAALAEAGRPAGRDQIDTLIARKAERYVAVAETSLLFFPGAAECLTALAGRWPLAVCSGALRDEIDFALKRLACRDRVTAIISAEDTTRCKPHPEGYLQTLEALRASGLAGLAAGECLVIEDSLAGVESARAAGMWVVGVTHTYSADELDRAGADLIVPGLVHISPAWIDKAFATRSPQARRSRR